MSEIHELINAEVWVDEHSKSGVPFTPGGKNLMLLLREYKRRGAEIARLTGQLRLANVDQANSEADLNHMRAALFEPDQPTAIANLIALRAEEATRDG